MKKILFVIALFAGISSYAQVGIGTSSPDASAQLDVVSTDKGILIPRIKLTGSSDITSIVSPKESLLIYNTSTVADVVPGFYYWNSLKWVALSGLSGNVSILNGGTGATTATQALTNLGAQSVANMNTVLGTTTDHYPSESAVRAYVDPVKVSMTSEIARAMAAESGLQTDLNSKALVIDLTTETARATNAEAGLQTNLNLKATNADLVSEVSRAKVAESGLQTTVDSKAATVDLVAETNRATNAETGLQTDLNLKAAKTDLVGEIARATAVESGLQTTVDSKAAAVDLVTETTRATNAETALQTNIDLKASTADLATETTRATTAETLLQTDMALKASTADLTTETTRATTAETGLLAAVNLKASTADLTTETTRATTAETGLLTAVNLKASTADLATETSRATSVENGLLTAVSLKASNADLAIETTRAINAETTINALKENISNKSNVINVQTNDDLYPSVKAVKTYVDALPSFYSANGTLTSARTVTQNNNDLTFTTGTGKLTVDGAFKNNGAVYSSFAVVTASTYTVPNNTNTIVYEGGDIGTFTMPSPSANPGMEIKIFNVSGYDVGFVMGTFSMSTAQATLYTGTGAILFSDGTKWHFLLGAL